MPPPSAYIDVTSFPFSQTVDNLDFNAGTYGNEPNNTWFRVVISQNQYLGTYTNSGGNFTPRSRMYRDNGGAMTLVRGVSNANAYYAEVVADTYWIEIYNLNPSFGSDTTFDFTTKVQVAAKNPVVPDESVVINDDANGFPAAIMTMDGTFLGFRTNVPAGETGAALPNGTLMLHDRFGMVGPAGSLAIINPDGDLVTSVTGASTTTIAPIANTSTDFYPAKYVSGGNTQIFRVSPSGVVTGPISTVTDVVQAMGVSPDGEILYYTIGNNGTAVQKWDLVNNVSLPDLYTVGELTGGGLGYIGLTSINTHPGDLLTLSDGSVVTWYRVFSPAKDVLIHVDEDGSLLNSCTYDSSDNKQIDHLSYAPDDPVGVRIWFFLSDPGSSDDTRGRYAHLTLSNCAESTPFETDLFSEGVNKVTGSDQIFGPSASCTFLTKVYGTSLPPSPDETTSPPVDISQPCPCPAPGTGEGPIPVGPFPPPTYTCTGGGQVEQVADLLTLEDCWKPLYVFVPPVPPVIGSPVGSPNPWEEEEPPSSLPPPEGPSDVELLA